MTSLFEIKLIFLSSLPDYELFYKTETSYLEIISFDGINCYIFYVHCIIGWNLNWQIWITISGAKIFTLKIKRYVDGNTYFCIKKYYLHLRLDVPQLAPSSISDPILSTSYARSATKFGNIWSFGQNVKSLGQC